MTIWSPDTCECVIEQTNNDPPTFVRVIRGCKVHQNLPTELDIWNAVMDENPRKNKVFGELITNGPVELRATDVLTGTTTFNNNNRFKFEYTGVSPNRVLHIKFNGYSFKNPDRNQLQRSIDGMVGKDKVILEDDV